MDEYQTNIIRAQFAATLFSLALQTGEALFGKSYLSLSVIEKATVDQLVQNTISANYAMLTPEWFAQQQSPTTVGFAVPAANPSKPSASSTKSAK